MWRSVVLPRRVTGEEQPQAGTNHQPGGDIERKPAIGQPELALWRWLRWQRWQWPWLHTYPLSSSLRLSYLPKADYTGGCGRTTSITPQSGYLNQSNCSA